MFFWLLMGLIVAMLGLIVQAVFGWLGIIVLGTGLLACIVIVEES